MAEHIGFVDTVIARMVPPLTPELRAQDPSLIIVEPYKELPVDRDGLRRRAAADRRDDPLRARSPSSPSASSTSTTPGTPCWATWATWRGYEYGYEALADDEIYFQARGAMEESALALTRKYRPPAGALLANIEDLLHRFGNRALGDTILRLGRDPLRKLARTDRLVGAALNALAEGVTPMHLVTGIAAGLRFDHPGRPGGAGLQARLPEQGIERVLAEVCGLPADEPLTGMAIERYRAMNDGR